MPRKPVILITAALSGPEDTAPGQSYSLRRNYADAIAGLGGLPLILPYQPGAAAEVLDLCDGVIISGSNPGETVARDRLEFEQALAAAAIAQGRPLLGICHGMQLIGQVLGGSLVPIEGLSEERRDGELHYPFEVPDQVAHTVGISDGSRLKALLNTDRIQVNSFHRHELRGQGDFAVAARSADDGVIEAIEGASDAFCLGLQWHPEFLVTKTDQIILECFLDACRTS